MDVILLQHVEKLGSIGDVKSVKNGFARNYLIPKNIALHATDANKQYFEAQRSKLEAANQSEQSKAEKNQETLNDIFITLIRQAGEDGRLYGSISARDITTEIGKKDIEVKRSNIQLEKAIKYLGVYPVKVKLHSDIAAIVNINVARTETEAESAKKAYLTPEVKKEDEDIAEYQAAEDKQTDEQPDASLEENNS